MYTQWNFNYLDLNYLRAQIIRKVNICACTNIFNKNQLHCELDAMA